ncbi:MAG TPA: hypothetical protein VKZ81_25180 [Pseudonocardia sp.]|uniref:hypothetical protein n=1 Tax=Pseudonocardia sp. TaxID=60912 RepID=UPI002B4B8839|nr:hypothetical protein [Pseudonocardia sp.]HLU58768.1 hypothetical protein [Pseudonocardia sp.]
MSPTSTARHRSTTPRKVALCAAAVLATLLPTACGAAYADSGHSGHGTEVVEVGGADAAEPAAVNAPDDDGDDDAEADAADGDEDAAEGDEEDADEKDADADGERRGNGGNGDNGKDNENKGKDNNGNGNDNNGNNNNGNNNNGGDEDNNGLDVLGRDCSNSDLEPHNGFQEAPRCVDTAFGEVASEEKSPSLLITESPETVKAGEEFTITVSTRNLIRDRFLGAAAGGYYLESSFLNEDGIQRGHFHTACRMLESTSEAPDAEPEPEFFLATQDNEGGEGPDFVEITVSGMPTAGTAQCAVWAGDGSHRIPMMQRADQTPAFDAVRITVE